MIKIEKVNKYYNKGKANQIHVINNTTMTLPDEGIVCLLGPSGCGKTTLLNAIGGLDSVDSGTITIDGQRITRFSSSKIDSIRNARIGYIFQNFNLIDDRTVFENVAMALRMIGIRDNTTVTARVRYCLQKVGIDQYRNKLAGSLSGGQRQRVAIARAIVKNPRIIIADEPTGNLDSSNTLEIMNIIKTISKERLVILVTHERNIAEFYSDYIAEMRDGKIIKAYNNDSSRYLDYQLENKIYLKDMAVHKGFAKDDVRVDVYSDEERQAELKVVIRGNNLYINTGGMLNVVDETSNVEMIDEHYTAMDESYFEDNDFDYTACLPSKYKARYTPVYRLTNMISSGWKTVRSFRKVRKVLMLGFVFAAMFAFLAVSNIAGLIDLKPVDYRTTNGSYITVSNPEKSEEALAMAADFDGVAFVMPGTTVKSVTLPMDDYLQTGHAQEDLTVSLVLDSVLTDDQIIEGAMPTNEHEVVMDRSIIDKFIRNGTGSAVGLDTMEEFIGRRLSFPNLDDYIIAGIADTESPSLFVDESQVMYILSNANDAGEEMSYGIEDYDEEDVIKSGRVKDLDLSGNTIKITKGRKPKAVCETIINEVHGEDTEIGETIDTRVAGRKLKVVGFYSSDAVDDDTYYVNAKTIKRDYIQKQKSFSVYANDLSAVEMALDNEGMASKINDVRDRKAYVSARRDQLTSSVIVAVIIILISLVEMFLMLRSSFLSRIREVGTLRAIGLKKKDIYRMFTGEILVITFITAVPGIAVMYFILTQVVRITYYIEGLYMVTPATALITFGVILVFNLLAGLIPVLATMRKTPAQILARTDI
ncbi:MAG: ABC transporter ATP-binding protein/permease [Mogibacterium sp.]|nr:ABC transporter ATP-binding protein/permease [Mogibacterium sp.]MBR4090385.1 ABC transporter ATP-binding protein/permease [Mogibacterium sp.]